MLELFVLGASDLRGQDDEGLTAILTQPKRLALLLYLHIARPHGFIRRDRLVAIFWPELDTTRSRNALSKSIHHIRRALGDTAIISRGDEVLLDGTFIRSDVQDLERALSSNDHERALELYRGPLADGLFVNEAPEFERWLDQERERIRTGVASAAWALADKSRKEGRFGEATTLARRAFSFTKEEEPALRRLMSFLENAGDRAGALRAYDTFSEWLRAELDAEPAPESQALQRRIREDSKPHFVESVPTREPTAVTAATSAPTTDNPRSSPWIRVATVGAA
ncbi:MAG: BTAD domain-containing putative transcriptional regulator, partial [Gemmatimonadaceae bacterium]